MSQHWVVTRKTPGEPGFLLYLVGAANGFDKQLTAEDELHGDPLPHLREVFGTYGNPGDFFIEPDRTYQMMNPERGV